MVKPTRNVYIYEFGDSDDSAPPAPAIEVDQDPAVLGATVWDSCLVAAKYLERNLVKLSRDGFSGRGTRGGDPRNGNGSHSPRHSESPAAEPAVRVIELGTGTGLLGIVAANTLLRAGKSVDALLTDLPDVASFAARNIALNDAATSASAKSAAQTVARRVQTAQLVWSADGALGDGEAAQWVAAGPVDVVLASDCVYDPKTFDSLTATLDSVCGDNTIIVLAYERREFDREVEFFRKFGKTFRFRAVPPEDMDPRFRAVDDIYLFVAKKRVSKEDF
ncbi:hypothetical protein HDU83_004283 [Entophlyctis luteolus]|nr:hypothetical protein HDU83_004283 [Entophlyctis luteolus]